MRAVPPSMASSAERAPEGGARGDSRVWGCRVFGKRAFPRAFPRACVR
jgi:hypothetical protein